MGEPKGVQQAIDKAIALPSAITKDLKRARVAIVAMLVMQVVTLLALVAIAAAVLA